MSQSVKDALADAETLELVPSGTRCVCGEMAVNHDAEGCVLGNGCYGFVAAGH